MHNKNPNIKIQRKNSKLFVISGPSGVGKDTILNQMKKIYPSNHYVVTVTTRKKRVNEIDGKDYFFVTNKKFQDMIDSNEFLEWATVYNNNYGVPKNQVFLALSENKNVIIKADIQGAKTIKNTIDGTTTIFINPPDISKLADHLSSRMSESKESFRLRMETSLLEIESQNEFDHVVNNPEGKIDQTLEKINAIISNR
jgi:guanylate kinase